MTTPSRRDLANAIRFLAIDAVQAANSGHPGMPMGMADIAEVLWNDFLSHNPADPKWFNRDRFILSNGHGSMLQYALLHLSGYDLSIDELKRFRQLHSKTPGHPENFETPGVETTTGPLGQGLANAVGMALAEKILAQRFNREGHDIVDHRTWVFLGDGCLMEGISHEVASLAGTWGLGKLVAFWDDNKISIDGNTDGWFTDDTAARFEAYGWRVIRKVNGQDPVEIKTAIETALKHGDKPTLICCRTTIGFGSPAKAGKESSHGAPLGKDEVAATRAALQWPYAEFEIPQDIYAGWRNRDHAGAQAQWQQAFDAYAAQFPAEAAELTRRVAGELPADFLAQADAYIAKLQADGQTIASRKASQMAIETFAPLLPELIGGSADLAHSNLTLWKASKSVASSDPNANYVYYGVREFGMTAISNGLNLHGGFIPFDATFLVFSDYARNAVRMSALMGAHAIHVYTHDSIGLGEDGPTHQSIEHAASLRLIPNLDVWRPGDTAETAVAWAVALQNQSRPTALLLSRQNIAYAPKGDLGDISRGAYVLSEPEAVGLKSKKTAAVIIATGSEVQLALAAQKLLAGKKIAVRVVSMPSTTTFDRQDVAYKKSVLPKKLPRIAVEMGCTGGWWKYGCAAVVGIDSYGESAPAPALFKHFGFTAENVAATVEAALRD